jgi:hypothetical protein
MIAYKGFNADLTCTRGNGKFQYEIGKTYTEDEAKCAHTGFHCVEEPIEVLRWYSGNGARYCEVEISGDIHEDGDDKISATEMTILKELTLEQIALQECKWIIEHPARKCSSKVLRNEGEALADDVVIVRGKNPKAKGEMGAVLFVMREVTGTPQIDIVGVIRIDGKVYKPDTWYNANGRAVRCRRKS